MQATLVPILVMNRASGADPERSVHIRLIVEGTRARAVSPSAGFSLADCRSLYDLCKEVGVDIVVRQYDAGGHEVRLALRQRVAGGAAMAIEFFASLLAEVFGGKATYNRGELKKLAHGQPLALIGS